MNAHSLKVVSNSSIENNCLLFRKLALEIALLGASVNIKIVPFYDESLIHFSKLKDDVQQNILNSLQIYLNVYKAVEKEGFSLLDTGRVVWNALAQHGYRPTSDLFSYIDSGNVIEIHNNQLVQVFRNLVFFKYCSYTLEELYCYNMLNLYSRDIAFETQLMEYVKEIYNGENQKIIKPRLKPHTINELASKKRLHIRDDIHYIAPLFSKDGGQQAIATLTIESARIESRGALVAPTNENDSNEYPFKPRELLGSDISV